MEEIIDVGSSCLRLEGLNVVLDSHPFEGS